MVRMTLMMMSHFVVVIALLAYSLDVSDGAEKKSTRIVFTQQGPVRGMQIDLQFHPSLGKVDAFLGIPYVSPPVGQFRFMPPMSPRPWTVVRDCMDSVFPRFVWMERQHQVPPPIPEPSGRDRGDSNSALINCAKKT